MNAPIHSLQMLHHIRMSAEVSSWIAFAAAAIPEYINEEIVTLVKISLSQNPSFVLYRDIVRNQTCWKIELEVACF